MTAPEENHEDYPVLVVAYDEKIRAALAASPVPFGVRAVACASFCQAQDFALGGLYRGILVDLATMIKAKDEEKIVAHTLTGIYPTLRVKAMGSMLIPMIMAGDAKQDKSLGDFFKKTCAAFIPRSLRSNKRKQICLPARIGAERTFTLNISWSGAFFVDVNPERYSVGQVLTATLLAGPGAELNVEVVVARIQGWGERLAPGIGVQFLQANQNDLEEMLSALLPTGRHADRDRLAC